MGVDGSAATNLTNDPETDATPAWSPDGTRIAYVRSGLPQAEIWVMNADGSGQRQVTALGGYAYRPSWSPDGTRIAFGDRATGAVYVVDVEGAAGPIRIADAGAVDPDPAWSPDGALIAYTEAPSLLNQSQSIVTIRPDGTGREVYAYSFELVHVPSQPAWAPDGRGMVVATASGIHLVAGPGSRLTGPSLTLATGLTSGSFPTWSPDGQWIAFDAEGGAGGRDIYLIKPDGTGLVDLASAPSDDWGVAWTTAAP